MNTSTPILTDNKLALDSEWDDDLLSAELERLREDEFDLDLIGFSDEELSDLLEDYDEGSASTEGLTDPDEIPEEPVIPITKPGDVWLMGNVHYICEDCGTQFPPEEAQKMNMECSCG